MDKKKEETPKDEDLGTLKGFRDLLRKQAGGGKFMADGGMVEEPTAAPALGDILKNLSSTPPTDYNFYKNISSEDRQKLYDQLNQQRGSLPNMAASALGGIGDAIARSYGGQNTDFQKNVQAGVDKNISDRLAAFDTQRAQKLQDIQAPQEAMMQDPNSPLSQSLRETAKAAGLQVPSGMSASLLVKVIPGFGDLANKQTQLMIQRQQAAETNRHNQADEAHQKAALKQQEEQSAITAAEKEADNKRQNLEILGKQGIVNSLFHPEVTKAAKEGAGLSPMAFKDADKEKRYQEWKSKQGR